MSQGSPCQKAHSADRQDKHSFIGEFFATGACKEHYSHCKSLWLQDFLYWIGYVQICFDECYISRVFLVAGIYFTCCDDIVILWF